MVLSRSARNGAAVVIPARRSSTPEDLFEEVRRLAIAENLEDNGKWRSFGAVGVLVKPGSVERSRVLEKWPNYFREHVNSSCEVTTLHGPGEAPSLRSDGFLDMEWPRCCGNDPSSSCDLLLATANAPTLTSDSTYPTPKQIAQNCLNAEQADYFKNNVLHGIRTAEDVEIWRHIKEANPAWITTDDYDRVSAVLGNGEQ
jgi:hypothetical protein